MTDLVQCARCGTLRQFSLTGICNRCGFQGMKRFESIEDHHSWPVYQARRFHWQESLRQAKEAHRTMALIQKELAQACVAIGLDASELSDDRPLGDVNDDDTANLLLAENSDLRRRLQECVGERDGLRAAATDFSEAVAKVFAGKA